MDYKEITALIKLVNRIGLTEFRLKEGDFEVLIRTDKYNKSGKVELPVSQAPPVLSPAQTQQPPKQQEPEPKEEKEKAEVEVKEAGENILEIKSPIVGTFYRSPAPDKPPYIKVGDVIDSGDVVCIVEAMKLFNEIESEISGKIVKVLVEDATPVEYDQVLFHVDPNG